MTWIMGIFSNTKNIIMLVSGIFGFGYIAVQKYKSAKAEDKLKTIENKIAKTNVVITKTKAKAKAQAVKAETDIHIETLKELKKEAKNVQKEMEIIEKDIEVNKKNSGIKNISGRKRKGKVSIEV